MGHAYQGLLVHGDELISRPQTAILNHKYQNKKKLIKSDRRFETVRAACVNVISHIRVRNGQMSQAAFL